MADGLVPELLKRCLFAGVSGTMYPSLLLRGNVSRGVSRPGAAGQCDEPARLCAGLRLWFLFCFSPQSAIESLFGASMTGIAYSLFAGQPLTILGSTGPVLVFEKILFKFCK